MDFKQWVARATTGGRLRTLAMAFAMAVGGVAVTSLPAQAQIANTKHNLGTTGTKATGQNYMTGAGATAEICVFCHTPHGADTSAAVPLWNRNISTTTTYTTYDSLGTTTLDGKTAAVGSVSIACLSCHDGTQAMSSVINTPGSGTTGTMGGTWTGNGVDSTGKITGTTTNLGTDLSNDHPIGIQYGGGGISSAGGTTTDSDFIQPTKSLTANVWWVETGGTGRQKTDLMLYTRAGGTGGTGYTGQTNPEPFVECASCHDPHTSNATFLRVLNTGSTLCLACHVK